MENLILGAYPNATPVYTPGLGLCHPIMNKLGVHIGRLERDRELPLLEDPSHAHFISTCLYSTGPYI